MLKLEIFIFLAFYVIEVSAVNAPSKPNYLRVRLLNEYSPIVELIWGPPYQSFGRIKQYRIFWGQKNGVTRFEKIPGNASQWTSDYLYDSSIYEFELRAENDVAIGEAAFVSFRTNTLDRVYPPNRRSRVFKNVDGSNTLQLSWNEPAVAVSGYRIFYKPLTQMYTGKWKKLDIPPLLSVDIPVKEPLSTVFGYYVIANTTTTGSTSVTNISTGRSRQSNAGQTNKNTVDQLNDLLITYLNKAPKLWALQAGINAMAPSYFGK